MSHFTPTPRSRARRKPDHEMRISYGCVTEAHLQTGIARLGKVLRGLMKSSHRAT